jgi:hypothetical protein
VGGQGEWVGTGEESASMSRLGKPLSYIRRCPNSIRRCPNPSALASATGRLSGSVSSRTRRSDPQPGGGRMWGFLVNPTALIPVTQPADLRQDRVGQLVQRVLDRLTSEETRRGYSHAPEMFLAFCGREGNPTLSAELVASYRVSLVGEGKSSSTVGVHMAAIKALTRAAVMAGLEKPLRKRKRALQFLAPHDGATVLQQMNEPGRTVQCLRPQIFENVTVIVISSLVSRIAAEDPLWHHQDGPAFPDRTSR